MVYRCLAKRSTFLAPKRSIDYIIGALPSGSGMSTLGLRLVPEKNVVFCDNEATVNIINKGHSSIPFINRFIRQLTWTSVMCNVTLPASHPPGLDNSIADSLSGFKFEKFRLLCPNAAFRGLIFPAFAQTVLD